VASNCLSQVDLARYCEAIADALGIFHCILTNIFGISLAVNGHRTGMWSFCLDPHLSACLYRRLKLLKLKLIEAASLAVYGNLAWADR